MAEDQESADQVRSSAHKLKSAARTVGAHVLADLCEAFEAAGKEKDWIKINEAGPAALIAFSHVRDRIQTGQ